MADFKLNFIHLCDEATFSQEGKLSLIGIFDILNVMNIPGNLVKAVLVCNFSVLNPNLESINIDITISKEGKTEPIVKIPTLNAKKFEKGKSTPLDTKETKMGITLQLTNIEFKSEGGYFINVMANGSLLGSYEFNVKKVHLPKKGSN